MWHAFSSCQGIWYKLLCLNNFKMQFTIGSEVLLREKLLSITSHMCNEHDFVENKEYKKCTHGNLDEDREKPWLDQDSLVQFYFSYDKLWQNPDAVQTWGSLTLRQREMLISNVYFFDGSVGLPAMPVTILMSGSVVPKVTTKHMVQSGPLEEKCLSRLLSWLSTPLQSFQMISINLNVNCQFRPFPK